MGQEISFPPVLDPTVFGFQLFPFSFSFPPFVLSWRDPSQRLFRYSQSSEDRKIKLNVSELHVSSFHGLNFSSYPNPSILKSLCNSLQLRELLHVFFGFSSLISHLQGSRNQIQGTISSDLSPSLSPQSSRSDFGAGLMSSFSFRRKTDGGHKPDYPREL